MDAKQAVMKTQTGCKPKACPSCGSVECFERPRYFCGQLLTDKDLDAGQRYLIEKNKLHNRYLVGAGVVCGLAVRCDPCPGVVDVEPGYAIDCCGNDIVVCETKQFDVNEYLTRCFKEKEPACEDKIRKLPSRCDEEAKEYCLVMSYSEEPVKPVTAMNRDNGCKTTRCEASRTRETFRLDLVTSRDAAEPDSFWSRAKACIDGIFPVIGDSKTQMPLKFPDKKPRTLVYYDKIYSAAQDGNESMFAVFCKMKEHILKMYNEGPRVRCGVEDELRQLEQAFPSKTWSSQTTASLVFIKMYGILLQLLKDCLCEALLVPCQPCDEEGVLLACLTVSGGRVTKICNTVRRQVVTGPALRYWLQPVVKGIGDAIDKLCCSLDLAELYERRFESVAAVEGKSLHLSGSTVESAGAMPMVALQRFGTMVGAAGAYAAESLSTTGNAALQQLAPVGKALDQVRMMNAADLLDEKKVVLADVSNQPVEDVKVKLTKAGIDMNNVVVEEETPEIAAARTPEVMMRPIPTGKRITLYKDAAGNVTAFRVG